MESEVLAEIRDYFKDTFGVTTGCSDYEPHYDLSDFSITNVKKKGTNDAEIEFTLDLGL